MAVTRASVGAQGADLVARFRQVRALVVGDVVLDEWIEGRAEAVAREAPVPTVDVATRRAAAGAAANVAANVAALGGRVRLATVTGEDWAGEALDQLLAGLDVDTSPSTVSAERRTRRKCRVVADGQVVARFDEGDRGELPPDLDAQLARAVSGLLSECDLLIVSDYGDGVLGGPRTRRVVADAARRGLVLVDAHELAAWTRVGCQVVTPNWAELCRLMGWRLGETPQADRAERVMAGAGPILQRTGSGAAVVTLDRDGAVLLRADQPARHVAAAPVDDPHSAGAGDTVAACLGLALAAGADLDSAVRLAMAAAGISVSRPGTVACRAEDLIPPAEPAGGLTSRPDLVAALRTHRAQGHRIVFTTGCFDILHAGHAALLARAAQLGDVLVVALNDDAGVRRLKGPGRPVNLLADRARLLAGMEWVDHVVAFSTEQPLDLINAVRPDVFVKGTDHDVERLAEARLTRALGGEVVAVPVLPEHSTAGVISACVLAGASQS